MRSRVVLEHLVKNHQVHVVVSGRAEAYLAKRFENVHGIWGFSVATQGNSVKKWQTVLANVKGAVSGWPHNIKTYFDLVDEFQPDVVISDFESFSYLFAKNHFLPVISVDNMQIINRCRHAPELLAGHEDQFELSRGIVKSKLPGCFHYLITSFFEPPIRKERTTLVPSILRPEVLALRSEPGTHLLVYQTATTNTELIDHLKASGVECRVYGYKRELIEDVVDGKVVFRPFSETQFLEDLRTAKAVVASAGFTLMGEAVFLKKPMLAVPLAGQFEQTLNAKYLQALGYGHCATQLDPATLSRFLGDLDRCQEQLANNTHPGNGVLFSALDAQLALSQSHRGNWQETTVT